MIYVSAGWFLMASLVMSVVGFTLLRYSRDGDLSNVEPKLQLPTDKDDILRELETRIGLPDVTWNVSLGIAAVSATAFMGLNMKPGFASWAIATAIVFYAQDTYIRWKTAHRLRRHIRECKILLDSLK
jgi:hypothetical protein